MEQQSFLEKLEEHIPVKSTNLVWLIIYEYNFTLKVTKERSTKHGDYRMPMGKKYPHKISVNGTLNKYAFLLTLLHEIAHMHAYSQYGRKIKPHGKEWKNIFRSITQPFIVNGIWPTDITEILRKYFVNPRASSAGFPELTKVFRKYDSNNDLYLDDIEEGCIFALYNQYGRWFQKGGKRRTRFLCKELETQRDFTIHGMAKIVLKDE